MSRSQATFVNDKHDAKPLDFGPDGCSRASITRSFSGDMMGTSRAELLACTIADDQFGYVGMDVFTGSLGGRVGGFVFQHGEMFKAGAAHPFGFIVTGSGTGELIGISGALEIKVIDDLHHVTLDWRLE